MAMAHGQTASFDVVLSAPNGAAIAGLPPRDRQAIVECDGVPAGIRCTVEPKTVDLAAQSSVVHVTIITPPAKARRLRGSSTEAYELTVKATTGTAVRAFDVGLDVK